MSGNSTPSEKKESLKLAAQDLNKIIDDLYKIHRAVVNIALSVARFLPRHAELNIREKLIRATSDWDSYVKKIQDIIYWLEEGGEDDE